MNQQAPRPDADPGAEPPVRSAAKHARLKVVVRTIGVALLTLIVISIVTFAATSMRSPEDVARNALGREATPEALVAYAETRGLYRPLHEQYASWLADFATGDMGVSAVTDRPVRDDVLPRLKDTLILSLLALAIAVPLSIATGVFMAKRSGSGTDLGLLMGTVVLAALPEFVIGISLIMIFGVWLGWFPVDSSALSFGTFDQKVRAFVLPTMTLVLAMLPHISRIARASAKEALATPYVAAAVLRGLSPRRVTWDHAMRNAAVPLVNAVALNIVYLLAGVIVVENVFAFPGIGSLFVEAIGAGDTVMVLAIAVVMGAMFIAISLVADMLAVYFNPRLKATA